MNERIGIADRVLELLQAGNGSDPGSTVLAKSATAGGGLLPMQDPNNSKLLVDEGYRKNVVIYSCINIIARTASEPDLVVGRTNSDGNVEPIKPGRGDKGGRNLQELLDHPNREQSQYDWLERSLIELGYSGNSITHKQRPKGGATRAAPRGPVAELWQLTPYRTELKLGKENLPAFYKFPSDNPSAAENIEAIDVIHIKRHDPANEHWGLSPLVVAARAGDLDNMATDYLRQMFHNLGEPSALLIFKEIKTRAQHQRARELWKDTHGKESGFHQIGTLDSSVTWQEVGSRPNDMALEGVFTHSETRICGAFGVPPILVATAVGLARSTYSNYREAVRDLWTDTLVPMYTRYGDQLTHRLAREFGDDLVIFFDTSKVGALQDDRKDLREFALTAWEKSLLPRNRCLALAQVEPVEEPARGNAYFVDENTQPVPIGLARDVLELPRRLLPADTLKLPPKVWRDIDRIADNAAPVLSAGFISAVSNAQSEVSLMALEQALKNNDATTAEASLLRAWEDQLADFRDDFREPLTSLYIKGGAVGDEQLNRATLKLASAPSETLNISEEEATQWIEAQLAELVEGVSEGTRRAIRAAVTQLSEGASLRTVAKQIRDRIGLTPRWIDFLEKKRAEGLSDSAIAKLTRKLIRKRAVNIALNEGRRAASEGQEFVWRRARTDGILKGTARQFWITAGDTEVCPICEPMDGQERQIGETFLTGDNRAVRLPPEPHNNCFIAATSVIPVGNVLSSFVREYEGQLVTICTAAGKNLSCTPNHPILTDRGWTAAGALDVGRNVISANFSDLSVVTTYLNDQKMPASIEEITSAYQKTLGVASVPMPVAAPHFHGDGKGSEIAVVSTNGELRNRLDVAFTQEPSERDFAGRYADFIPLPGSGTLDDFCLGTDAPASRSVRGSHLVSTLSCGHPRPLDSLGVTMATPLDSGSEQSALDPIPVVPKNARESILRFSGQIKLDEVVNVSFRHFKGPVYNLETATNVIVAQGVVASNCRCARGIKLKR